MPETITLQAAAFADLDVATLYALLRLRVDTFVVEQQCCYPELDGRDTEPTTEHLWLAQDGQPVAYLRLLAEPDGTAAIGRVVVAGPARGAGLAGRLLAAALDRVGPRECVLKAQSHLAGFYGRYGFVPTGPEFMDDGIPHLPMRRSSPPPRETYQGVVATQVIVLNGGSSSGKSELARSLQAVLPNPWLSTGVDALIEAMPASMQATDVGVEFAADGGVKVGPAFDALQAAWMAGVAAMVRAGARVILDEVFLGGAASQQRWRRFLTGLDVLWVGVRCDSAVAEAREAARGDRVAGMAGSQAEVVHQGVAYDLEVDTTYTDSLACARTIAARVLDRADAGC